jgi:hypothetical protein|tara:strand:- start:165 stop:404 length:240 start_codon:yes stop_codon:yes gene_type:complete
MQKYLNLLGVVGFVLAAANTALLVFAVVRGPALVEENLDKIQALMIEKMHSALSESVTEAMPSQVKELMPSTTGPALPF